MHVLTCQVHNICGISDLQLDLTGHHLYILGGKNGHGKTSGIMAIKAALCGKRALGNDYPSPLLKNGEDEGSVKIALSGDDELHDSIGFTVEHALKRYPRTGEVKEFLTVTESTGEKAASARQFLTDLFNLRGFDPFEFDRMDRQLRRKTLMEVVGLNFDEYIAKRDNLVKERSGLERDGKLLAAKLAKMPFDQEHGTELLKPSELIKEITDGEKHNSDRNALAKRLTKAQADIGSKSRGLADTVNDIEELEERLRKMKEGLATDRQSLDDATAEAVVIQAELDETPTIDLTQQKAELLDIEGSNAIIQKNIDREKVNQEIVESREKFSAFNKKIKLLQEAQDKRLSEANWPVPGLSVDTEGVLYEGLPYERASTSKRMLISAGIGASLNPKLRLLISHYGSELDLDSMKVLEQWCIDNDFQMILEVVTRSESDEELCQIVMENGKAKHRKLPKSKGVKNETDN